MRQVEHYYRVRFRLAGAHYHCRVFSRPQTQGTWAKCGDLIVSASEWVSFELAFDAEFLDDNA